MEMAAISTNTQPNDAGEALPLPNLPIIIFDEFHERSIHADLALALCLDLCQLKENLRILVMSATLEACEVAALLGNVPIITGEG